MGIQDRSVNLLFPDDKLIYVAYIDGNTRIYKTLKGVQRAVEKDGGTSFYAVVLDWVKFGPYDRPEEFDPLARQSRSV